MRAVLVQVPESLLAERRRLGIDRWDEVWDGELHMAPAPSGGHQRLGFRLAAILLGRAEEAGLVASYETELYRPDAARDDYRVPDQVFCQPAYATARGVSGRAELVIEIRSPGDETYEKVDFYAKANVQELLVIDPETCRVELFCLVDDRLRPVDDAGDGVSSQALQTTFTTSEGPVVRLTWATGGAEIHGRV